jgi:hypothetical protein
MLPGVAVERQRRTCSTRGGPNHGLEDADVERFGVLEAMLDQEGFASRHTSGHDQMALRVLDSRAIAGMHAAAVDLSAAMRPPATSRGTSTTGRGVSPPRGTLLEDDGDEGVENEAIDYDRGLVESLEAYQEACERNWKELDSTKVPSLGSSPVLQSPKRPIGGSTRSPGTAPGVRPERVPSLNGVVGIGSCDAGPDTWARDELYPVGRIIHLVPMSWLHLNSEVVSVSDGERPASLSGKDVGAAFECEQARSDGGGVLVNQGDAAREFIGPRKQNRLSRVGEDIADEPVADVPVGGVARGPPTRMAVDCVPQQAYSRVSLCKTMLADHYLSQYIESMDAVIAAFAAGTDDPV